ncbi:MAG: deoxyguanosinetriphosphate triphosphohydrolase [Clostridiales bacterium]|uniref:Deoxyguanosinetriphosphate triphosphohydrolase-like protein n=1 Tax=Enterocloster alcoholdehydrogenati TaxID=2547410 RepID=A0ABQ0AYJ3_9FIRM|nr:deoxyguanosinetriphosphate triphosphohydrolase [Enterocloster alcoholdehydrogenati]MBS7140204.1 deoxyguanosinetriphosphate triphosphohydrolase [Clostridiales bacterium]
MNVRESLENLERETLSPYASLSAETRGRERKEPLCDIRPEYQRDRDRILHCKAFRRLKHKTQVFLAPEGDHYRTRLTHTLEVAQIARTIAKSLRLNESLTEAIAMGHDLGHTPFGHSGEYILNQICEDGFTHYEQSVRIVEILEKDGKGLNLTWEVKDGILNHRTAGRPSTLEGAIVRLSDKIAYINHDIDDAIRARMFVEEELPAGYTDVLGHSVRERLNRMIHDIIRNSMDKPQILMSTGMEEAMKGLRQWMFEHVYKNDIPKAEESKAQEMIARLYEYYMKHVDQLPMEYVLLMVNGEKKSRVVCDYIAGMSDIYAIDQFEALFVPKRWNIY